MAYSPDKIVKDALSGNDLVAGFRDLGIREGMVLEVHTSMKQFGYIIGGSQTMVDALIEAVGYEGTLVMPLQASSNTEPAFWENPPVDRSLWSKVRDSIPAFDPDATEFNWMGAVPNNLNRRAGAYRSIHPSEAFVTYGRFGKLIAQRQQLDFGLGDESPLAAMYEMPSYVLLAGVGYDNCTAMHLGEYRSKVRDIVLQGSAFEKDGERQWVKYMDIDMDSDDFPEIGARMEQDGLVTIGQIGQATCRLFRLADAVDYAETCLKEKYGNK